MRHSASMSWYYGMNIASNERPFNSSSMSYEYMRQLTRPSLVHLFGYLVWFSIYLNRIHITNFWLPGYNNSYDYFRRMAKVMFSLLSIGLSVCMSVSMLHLILCIHSFFSNFSGESMYVTNITAKWVNKLSWNFQCRLDMRQGTIWNICRMLHSTLWIQEWFFYYWICVW